MRSKRSFFLFVFVACFLFPKNAKTQKYITASTGYSAGSLFDFRKNDWHDYEKYGIKNGYFVSLSFDSLRIHQNVRFRIQLGSQNFVNESSQGSHFGPTIGNYEVQVQYGQIDFNYLFRLSKDKKTTFNLFLGPTFSYNIRSVLNGNGSSPDFHSFTDSLGYVHTWYSSKDWEIKDQKSSKFSGFNFGFNLGLSVCYPIKDRLDFVFENRYSLFMYQIINISRSDYGSFLRGDLSMGLRFKI
ncbi:MAG: hypothetical protein FGM14_15010 [Flavobacteriales bacterium]|nr:hypothetical protein [Flavobacteriales bacterium]